MISKTLIALVFILQLGASYAQDIPADAVTDTPAEQAEAPSPAMMEDPAVPETPKGPYPCSYTGRFVISPLVCARTYLSYVYPRCDSIRVTLLTKKQLRSKPYRAVWTMNGASFGDDSISTPIKSYKRSDCSTRYLQSIAGTNMRMGALSDDWVIEPVEGSDDCFRSVSIYSKFQGGYLSAASSCDSFSFTDDVGLGETFEVKSV